jgi:hypothetical protein
MCLPNTWGAIRPGPPELSDTWPAQPNLHLRRQILHLPVRSGSASLHPGAVSGGWPGSCRHSQASSNGTTDKPTERASGVIAHRGETPAPEPVECATPETKKKEAGAMALEHRSGRIGRLRAHSIEKLTENDSYATDSSDRHWHPVRAVGDD